MIPCLRVRCKASISLKFGTKEAVTQMSRYSLEWIWSIRLTCLGEIALCVYVSLDSRADSTCSGIVNYSDPVDQHIPLAQLLLVVAESLYLVAIWLV